MRPTDFNSGFAITDTNVETKITSDALSNITYLQLTHAGYTYPQTPYNLTRQSATDTVTVSNNNDMFRCYSEYLAFSDSFRDRNGSLMTYSQYLVQPVFIFKTRSSLNNINNMISVTCNLKTTSASSNMFIMALYDNFVTCVYDELGRKSTVSVSAGPPIVESA